MSEMIVNKLTGKTSAGDIDVVSEGGNATMQLQQGLAKAWLCHNAGTVRDSFNHSSITDNATGNFTIAITSSMSNADYVVSSTNGNSYHSYNNVTAVNQYVNYAADNSHTGYDDPQMKSVAHGDLA